MPMGRGDVFQFHASRGGSSGDTRLWLSAEQLGKTDAAQLLPAAGKRLLIGPAA
jgi:hypothetical protein